MNMDNEKISPAQFTGILVMTVLPSALLSVPAITISLAGRDAWMAQIFAGAFAMIVVLVSTMLAWRFPDKTIFQYPCEILGKYLGKAVGLAYLFFFIIGTAHIIRQFGAFLIIAYMPRTPVIVFIMVLIILAAYAVKSGFEVIARMNQFILLLVLVLLFGIFVLIINEFRSEYFFPIMEHGAKPVLRAGLTPAAWQGEVFILMVFIPYLNKLQQARAAAVKSVALLTVVLFLNTVICIGVFELQAGNFLFPVYSLADYIGVAGFIERVEAVVLALWVSGMTLKVAIWYYGGALGISQIFGLQDYKPVVFPLGLILGVLALIVLTNSTEAAEFFAGEFPIYAMTFELIFPLGLLIFAVIRKKRSVPQKGGKSK